MKCSNIAATALEALPPTARTVRCPACGGPSAYASSNPFRPFCGERCKTQDLSAWATERYAVEAPPGTEGDDLADSQ
jgi:endogenous inhibitor of DNA gyrase (YacG/DUF329 family)